MNTAAQPRAARNHFSADGTSPCLTCDTKLSRLQLPLSGQSSMFAWWAANTFSGQTCSGTPPSLWRNFLLQHPHTFSENVPCLAGPLIRVLKVPRLAIAFINDYIIHIYICYIYRDRYRYCGFTICFHCLSHPRKQRCPATDGGLDTSFQRCLIPWASGLVRKHEKTTALQGMMPSTQRRGQCRAASSFSLRTAASMRDVNLMSVALISKNPHVPQKPWSCF